MTTLSVLLGLLIVAMLGVMSYYGWRMARWMVAFGRVEGSLMLAERKRCLGLVTFYAEGMPHQNVYRRLAAAIENGEQPMPARAMAQHGDTLEQAVKKAH